MGDKAVRCLYCGGEVNPDRTFKSMLYPGFPVTFWYQCDGCGATSPRRETPELAYAAAMRRYEPENRVMTAEEKEERGDD